MDKISKRLSVWKENSLSIGGRITLIKSVLGSLLIYYMTLYWAPTHVMNTLKQIRNFFFVRACRVTKRMCVGYLGIEASKENGGAGIGSIGATIKALLVKWSRRFKHEKHQLWAPCIFALHQTRRN